MLDKLEPITKGLGDMKMVMDLVKDSVTKEQQPWAELMGHMQDVSLSVSYFAQFNHITH
jgi:hypothetical protein